MGSAVTDRVIVPGVLSVVSVMPVVPSCSIVVSAGDVSWDASTGTATQAVKAVRATGEGACLGPLQLWRIVPFYGQEMLWP